MGDTQANQRKKTRGEDYIAQGSILAVAVVITKIIGVVYRIPLTNILGDEGNGFYGYNLHPPRASLPHNPLYHRKM